MRLVAMPGRISAENPAETITGCVPVEETATTPSDTASSVTPSLSRILNFVPNTRTCACPRSTMKGRSASLATSNITSPRTRRTFRLRWSISRSTVVSPLRAIEEPSVSLAVSRWPSPVFRRSLNRLNWIPMPTAAASEAAKAINPPPAWRRVRGNVQSDDLAANRSGDPD